MSTTITQGDILAFDGDCIVNPANSHLDHMGGLAGMIEQAAMRGADEEQRRAFRAVEHRGGLLATGNATAGGPGALNLKGIIHAVGPVWNGGKFLERELLALAYQSAFQIAAEKGWYRIAVPAISCGVFGFPVQIAAPIALDEASHAESDMDVTFVLWGHIDYAAFNEALKGG